MAGHFPFCLVIDYFMSVATIVDHAQSGAVISKKIFEIKSSADDGQTDL